MRLYIETQGRKGGKKKSKNDKGYVLISYERTKILIDAFEGSGPSYKERDKPEIIIEHLGSVLFKGTVDELESKLKK